MEKKYVALEKFSNVEEFLKIFFSKFDQLWFDILVTDVREYVSCIPLLRRRKKIRNRHFGIDFFWCCHSLVWNLSQESMDQAQPVELRVMIDPDKKMQTVYSKVDPMMGCYSIQTFFSLWGFLLLSTVVAQSVGLFVGASCIDLQVSVTVSALYSLSTMLFGGYYASTLPSWLQWLQYGSMVHYAFHNMQIVEFGSGPPIRCAQSNSLFELCRQSNTTTFIPVERIIQQQGQPLPMWANTIILIGFLIVFRCLGYAVLRYVRKPK